LKELKKSRSDVQDIAMSVKVERGDKNNPLRNEIDVMALINNRLYIIECKTGMLKPQESQLALYRLDSLAEVFGPLTQGALLSFDSISPLIKRRANEININVLDSKNMVQVRSIIDKRASMFSTPDIP
ncbi:Card1-like endonuclease domain-containing protein, partial [Vibrio sinaloensis]